MRIAFGLAGLLVVGAAAVASAQNTTTTAALAPLTFSTAQVEAGQVLYEEHCGYCHGEELGGDDGPPLADGALDHWFALPTAELYSFVRQNMPIDAPGSLTAPEYAAVVAFILQHNGFVAGDVPLPTDAAALQAMGYLQ